MRLALALLLASFAVTPSGLAPAAWAQGRAGAETEEEQAFQAAEAAFNSGRFDDAAPLYERAITLNPSRGEAWIKRAVIHYKQRQYNEAVQLLRRGQQAVPGDLGIKAQLGLSLYRSGAQDVAVGLLEEVVAARPGMPDVQLQLATHYVRVGDGKKAVTAIEAYGRARTGEAPDPETQIQIRLIAGSAYLLNRQHPEAEREFDAVLKLRPGDEVARLSLGQVFAARGDCSQAITIYERLLQLAPKKPFVYFDLGNCYLKVNRRVEAEKMAAAYTQQRPKEAKGFLLLGDTRLESRDFAGALGAYDQARKLEPAAGTVDARMGKAYLGQRNFPAAVAVLEKALAARPGEVEIMTQLADAYAATRQPAEKLLAIGRELQRVAPPTDSEALTGSGLAYYAAGEDAQAAQIFAAALQANPSARRARTGLQMALTRGAQGAIVKGEIARAEELLERALKLDPEALQANRNLALVQIMARKFEPAAKLLEGLLKKVPRDQVVNRLLGRALLGLKRPADAVRAYETAAQSAQRNRGPALAEINAELGLLYLETGKVEPAVALRYADSSNDLRLMIKNLDLPGIEGFDKPKNLTLL